MAGILEAIIEMLGAKAGEGMTEAEYNQAGVNEGMKSLEMTDNENAKTLRALLQNVSAEDLGFKNSELSGPSQSLMEEKQGLSLEEGLTSPKGNEGNSKDSRLLNSYNSQDIDMKSLNPVDDATIKELQKLRKEQVREAVQQGVPIEQIYEQIKTSAQQKQVPNDKLNLLQSLVQNPQAQQAMQAPQTSTPSPQGQVPDDKLHLLQSLIRNPQAQQQATTPKTIDGFKEFMATNPNVQKWREQYIKKYGKDPKTEGSNYDYKGAYEAGIVPQPDEKGEYHWGSKGVGGKDLKSEDHPTRWKSDFMEATGIDPDRAGITQEKATALTDKLSGKEKGLSTFQQVMIGLGAGLSSLGGQEDMAKFGLEKLGGGGSGEFEEVYGRNPHTGKSELIGKFPKDSQIVTDYSVGRKTDLDQALESNIAAGQPVYNNDKIAVINGKNYDIKTGEWIPEGYYVKGYGTEYGYPTADTEIITPSEVEVQEAKKIAEANRNFNIARNKLVTTSLAFIEMAEQEGAGRFGGFIRIFTGGLGINEEVKAFEGELVEAASALAKLAAPSARVGEKIIAQFKKTLPNKYSTWGEFKNQMRYSMHNAFATAFGSEGKVYKVGSPEWNKVEQMVDEMTGLREESYEKDYSGDTIKEIDYNLTPEEEKEFEELDKEFGGK